RRHPPPKRHCRRRSGPGHEQGAHADFRAERRDPAQSSATAGSPRAAIAEGRPRKRECRRMSKLNMSKLKVPPIKTWTLDQVKFAADQVKIATVGPKDE